MTVFYPLDSIRTLIQVGRDKGGVFATAQDMVKKDGLTSFYAGLSPVLQSLAVSNFVYFYANNLLKVLLRRFTQTKEVNSSSTCSLSDFQISVVQNLAIASTAGVINVMLTCPLWVANTRLRLQRNSGPLFYFDLPSYIKAKRPKMVANLTPACSML